MSCNAECRPSEPTIAMTRHVALDSAEHRRLRIHTGRSPAFGDDMMSAPTFPGEFRNVLAHYPIVFAKDAAGAFQPHALFGLRQGENLFLDGERWDAHYVPLAVERMPFLIGNSDGNLGVHVDLDHPRVGDAAGEPLFDGQGNATPLLERAASILRALHEGLQSMPAFTAALLEHQLLEPFTLDVQLDDGRPVRLAGLYAVHEERLRTLDGTALAALHAAGHLEPAYLAIASLSQLRGLIERMRERARRS